MMVISDRRKRQALLWNARLGGISVDQAGMLHNVVEGLEHGINDQSAAAIETCELGKTAIDHCELRELRCRGVGFDASRVLQLAAPLQTSTLEHLTLESWSIPLRRLVDPSGVIRLGGDGASEADLVLAAALLGTARECATTLELGSLGAAARGGAMSALASAIGSGHLAGLERVSVRGSASPEHKQLLRTLGVGCPRLVALALSFEEPQPQFSRVREEDESGENEAAENREAAAGSEEGDEEVAVDGEGGADGGADGAAGGAASGAAGGAASGAAGGAADGGGATALQKASASSALS